MIKQILNKPFFRWIIQRWTKSRFKPLFILWMALYQKGKILMAYKEARFLYKWVKKTKKIDGAIAEVGVYKGGSARIIREADKKKEFYLIDTFRGIPSIDEIDLLANTGIVRQGKFEDTSIKEVEKTLGKLKNVFCFVGEFPNILLPERVYSFVHLDVDTYKSTKNCLEYFYPRMLEGGVIISHDYSNPEVSGVKRAFDEFFKNDPKKIELGFNTQCIIKI